MDDGPWTMGHGHWSIVDGLWSMVYGLLISEARAALATLPLVREGLIDFELVPLAPYPGFARLFGPIA